MATTDTDVVAAHYLKALALALPKELAEVLLPPLRLRSNAGRLVVVVPNPIWRDVFHELAAERLRGLLKPKGLSLQVVCRQDVANRSTASEQRFSTFLQDPGNQLALTACRRAVEAPGLEHNPLYLHGPAGCGKSHLLAAIAAEYRGMLDEHAVVAFTGAKGEKLQGAHVTHPFPGEQTKMFDIEKEVRLDIKAKTFTLPAVSGYPHNSPQRAVAEAIQNWKQIQ